MVDGGEKLEIKETKGTMQVVTDLEEERMAFKGDFEKVDIDVKAQMKAMIQSDFTTMRKIRQGEMN